MLRIKLLLSAIGMLFTTMAFAQFHTLNIPHASNAVTETQRLGVTDITVTYHSPSANGRDVWNDTHVIPQNGNPIPWRAGANMNTTIKFSTDVSIEGHELKAGVYGFHVIPKGEAYTLLFAHNHEQWGSYYLNIEADVTLSVDVSAQSASFSEKLDYEFLNWKENSVVIGLEWADKRLPFSVSVDLNKTVTDSFRSELRGINTYHWQAWNDAASWCLNHNTNLEEALLWAERSINGGFNGFAANKNFTNVSTKLQLLKKLKKEDEFKSTLNDIESIQYSTGEAYQFSRMLIGFGDYSEALEFTLKANIKYPDTWFLIVNEGISMYFLNQPEDAIKAIERALELAPQSYHERFQQVANDMKSGIYKLPS
ncbi:hypothetical protein A9Q87_01365 [Flavobacteriales bacterium 34_180_T64]|nr:hypothetical protein A9Q87_01365 [Flavobacteriales bacterium 34_180_T64]